MLDLSHHKYVFDTTGVTVARDLIPAATWRQMTGLLESHYKGIENAPWKFPVMHLGRQFWECVTNSFVLDMCKEFCGEHFRLDHAFGLSSNGAIAQLHGGPQSSQHSCFYHPTPNSGRLAICGQLNFGICIQGQNPTTGGFAYVPGSHKQSNSAAGREILAEIYGNFFDHPSIVVPTLAPGDVLVFTEALIHGDTGWKGPKMSPRVQVYYKMTPGWMCWRDPRESYELLEKYAQTPLERAMIEPPWTGRYTEDSHRMGVDNERRKPTREERHTP